MYGHYYPGGVVVGQVTYAITSTPAARCGERHGETHFEHATPEAERREEDVDAHERRQESELEGGDKADPRLNLCGRLEERCGDRTEAPPLLRRRVALFV
jgi:hypothetical protein